MQSARGVAGTVVDAKIVFQNRCHRGGAPDPLPQSPFRQPQPQPDIGPDPLKNRRDRRCAFAGGGSSTLIGEGGDIATLQEMRE